MSHPTKFLPSKGHASEDVIRALEDLRHEDCDWAGGKIFCLVFHAGDEVTELAKRAYTTYFAENGLNPSVFPSLKRLETEVVAMTASLLGGGASTVGNMTTGGTESILMAVKAAREWGRAQGGARAAAPEMVLPTSAHPAFEKAAHYFGVKPVHVPVGKDFRAVPAAMRKAVTRATVMLVGSAPAYPQGVVDPISEIAEIAASRGLLCHVDACVGGFMLPFVRALGRPVPDFDLSVPGVTSMSVDLHKYGYTPKGASVVLYRDPELRRHQYFAYTDWPGGIYVSPTMTGTRSGGAVAAAWAVLQRLGHDGYLEIAREVMDAADRIRRGVDAIPGLEVLGEPHMSVMAIGSSTIDVYEVGDNLSERGWHLDRQQSPASLHLTVNHAHLGVVDRFLDDLRAAARIEPVAPIDRFLGRSRDLLMGAAVRVLPSKLVTRVTRAASSAMGMAGGGELPKRSAAMYGLMTSLPNRGDLTTMVVELLDKMTRYDPAKEIGIPKTATPPSPPPDHAD